MFVEEKYKERYYKRINRVNTDVKEDDTPSDPFESIASDKKKIPTIIDYEDLFTIIFDNSTHLSDKDTFLTIYRTICTPVELFERMISHKDPLKYVKKVPISSQINISGSTFFVVVMFM